LALIEPRGNPLSSDTGAAGDCPLRFPGQYRDEETGWHYSIARYYDPVAGRYTSPDPLGLVPAPNNRAYVPNPLVWIDPLGMSVVDRGVGHGVDPGSVSALSEIVSTSACSLLGHRPRNGLWPVPVAGPRILAHQPVHAPDQTTAHRITDPGRHHRLINTTSQGVTFNTIIYEMSLKQIV
jgi:RHS repeat-associated protein